MLNESEKAIAHIAGAITIFSIRQNNNTIPKNTSMIDFILKTIPEDIKPIAQMGIGAVNIFAGILTTIAQFLKIGELNEAHRVSSISWDKFYRNIKVELSKSLKSTLL